MGVIMKEFLITIAAVILFCVLFIFAAEKTHSKETTTLDDAINRPVVIEKYVDKANNVVCYYEQKNPRFLTCLQRRGLRQHNSDVK
jgi:hypothetical protein